MQKQYHILGATAQISTVIKDWKMLEWWFPVHPHSTHPFDPCRKHVDLGQIMLKSHLCYLEVVWLLVIYIILEGFFFICKMKLVIPSHMVIMKIEWNVHLQNCHSMNANQLSPWISWWLRHLAFSVSYTVFFILFFFSIVLLFIYPFTHQTFLTTICQASWKAPRRQ